MRTGRGCEQAAARHPEGELTSLRSMSRVSGTPSITESPLQMTPARAASPAAAPVRWWPSGRAHACGILVPASTAEPAAYCGSIPLNYTQATLSRCRGAHIRASTVRERHCALRRAPSQSKMKQSTELISFSLSSAIARRAAAQNGRAGANSACLHSSSAHQHPARQWLTLRVCRRLEWPHPCARSPGRRPDTRGHPELLAEALHAWLGLERRGRGVEPKREL